MKMSKRSMEKEWMDLGSLYYTPKEYEECLHQLNRLGWWLGGERATRNAFARLKRPPASIVDVGCGGGALALKLAQYYPTAAVVGVDTAPEAIAFARKWQAAKFPAASNITFTPLESPSLPFHDKSVDVVTATLLCHHLHDEALLAFLKHTCRIAKQAVILNDLHRHPVATMGYALIAPIFFPNRMIIHDGLISIKRAFTRADWSRYLEAAGIPLEKCHVQWHFPFRWTVFIDTM